MDEKKNTIKALSMGRRDLYQIDPRVIKEKPGFNVRLAYTEMDSLVNYVMEHRNVPVPLKVFMEEGEVFVDQGHRRLRAVMTAIGQGADIKSVDCIGEPKHYNAEQRLIDMVASNEGVPLNMLEQGVVFNRLIKAGYNQSEVGVKVGKTPSHISGCVMLATASKKIQNLIIEGTVKPSTVLNLMRENDDDEAIFLALTTAKTEAEAEGKDVVTPSRARKAAGGGSGKPTPGKKVKELGEWFDENSIVMGERPKFKMISYVLQYINGDLSLEQLATFTD